MDIKSDRTSTSSPLKVVAAHPGLGTHTIGENSTNAIIIDSASAPNNLGEIQVTEDGKILFKPASGLAINQGESTDTSVSISIEPAHVGDMMLVGQVWG